MWSVEHVHSHGGVSPMQDKSPVADTRKHTRTHTLIKHTNSGNRRLLCFDSSPLRSHTVSCFETKRKESGSLPQLFFSFYLFVWTSAHAFQRLTNAVILQKLCILKGSYQRMYSGRRVYNTSYTIISI